MVSGAASNRSAAPTKPAPENKAGGVLNPVSAAVLGTGVLSSTHERDALQFFTWPCNAFTPNERRSALCEALTPLPEVHSI